MLILLGVGLKIIQILVEILIYLEILEQMMGGCRMAAKKKEVYIMPRKIYWHLYSLQNLNSEKFIKVVNKVLRKEYMLIK